MDSIALAYEPLLRHLATDPAPATSWVALGALVGKDRSNLKRDLPKLATYLDLDDRGFPLRLTVAGRRFVTAMDVDAGNATTEPVADNAYRPTLHAAIRPDPNNPRKLFDPDGLAELAASIAKDGLLEPLVIRPISGEDGAFMLIAGERRWRAIGEAIKAGTWAVSEPIPAMVRLVDEQDAQRLALIENLQRRDLNAVEEARAIQALVELTGKSAGALGIELGFTDRWAQQRVSLLKLPETVQRRVEIGSLKVEEARELVTLLPKLPAVKQVEIERGVTSVKEAKAWFDAQPKPLDDRARLVIVELLEKLEAKPFKADRYSPATALIAAETRREDRGENGVRITVEVDDPTFTFLVKQNILDRGRIVFVEEVETAMHSVMLANYWGEQALRARFPDALKPEKRKQLLPTLRAAVMSAEAVAALPEGVYATPWLNAEWQDPAGDIAAEIERRREAKKESAAKFKAERKAEQTHLEAKRAAAAAALNEIASAANSAIQGMDCRAQLRELAARHGHPLPWFDDHEAQIYDAGGKEVIDGYFYGDGRRAAARLIVCLVNAGAGLERPARRPSELAPDAPPREAFLELLAGALLQPIEDGDDPLTLDPEVAKAAAGRGLQALLDQEEIDYAAVDYDWGEDGIRTIAYEIVAEGLGQQVDIEEAIEAKAPSDVQSGGAADVELSPALLALAGVRGDPGAA